MRTQYIPGKIEARSYCSDEAVDCADSLDDAEALAPWACEVIRVDGGFMAFESAHDYAIWLNQV